MKAGGRTICMMGSIALVVAAASVPALAEKKLQGERYLKDARISLTDARATALKTFPGTIVDQELEKEKGGSGLRYSFDIRNGSATHEVGIDAKDGSVLENSVEGPHSD